MIVDERPTIPEAQGSSENANTDHSPPQGPPSPNEYSGNPASPEYPNIDRPAVQGGNNSTPPPGPPHNPTSTPDNNPAESPSWGRIGVMALGGAMCIAPMVVAAPILGLVGFGAAGPIAGTIAAGWQAGVGSVAAGGVFATLQSAAMGGYGVAAVSGVTQAVGAAVSVMALRRGGNEPSPSCSPSCPCLCHRSQHPGASPSPPSSPTSSSPARVDTPPPPPYTIAPLTLPPPSTRCVDSCPCSCHHALAPDAPASSEKR